MKHGSCVLAIALGLVSAAVGQEKARRAAAPSVPMGATILRNLQYGAHVERNRLDLYLPVSTGTPAPLVIWVHGGAWRGGNKDICPAVPFVADGFAVASINYRLSQHAVFPAQIEDCKAAVRWLRSNAKKYHLAADRFGVWGASAGGHLVALLGTAGDVRELEGIPNPPVSSRVQAVCDFFGPTDFTKMNEQSGANRALDHDDANAPEALLLGGAVQRNKEKAAKANPITYVTKDDPPFLILHGDQDNVVPPGQSELLHEALRKAGVDSTLQTIAGAGHGRGVFTPQNLEAVEAFFQKHLRTPSAQRSTEAKQGSEKTVKK